MKKITKITSLFFFTFSWLAFSQDFSIANGTSLTIVNNSDLYVNGLSFKPDSDFTVDGPIILSKNATPIGSQSINRVFESDNLIQNFQGTLTFFYNDTELNGVTESDLVLQVKDELGNWNSYSGVLDTNINSLTYGFGSAVNFDGVTATANGVTLSTENFNDLEITIFPNPVTSGININTEFDVNVSIYNVNGQLLLKTDKKKIDLSEFSNGIYLFEVRNKSSQIFNTYKVVKKQ